MLIHFSVENYKSFYSRVELNMAARPAEKMIAGATIPVDLPGSGINVLLAATAIYGANASGKTNLISALGAVDSAVAASQVEWKRGEPLPFDPHLLRNNEPSQFELQLIREGVRYRYGFIASKERFLEEWLYSYPVGRERMLFQRTTSAQGMPTIEFGPHLSGDKRANDSIFSRVRDNSLFISAGAQDNQSECTVIYKWFAEMVRYGDMDIDWGTRTETSILAFSAPNFKSLLVPLMQLSDPSISDIKISFDGDSSEALEILRKGYDSLWDNESRFDVSFVISDGDDEITVPFEVQSRGVKKLYDLASLIINALAFGSIVVVDELEASMHPHVAAKILALFQSRSSNPRGAQLIFTTHETRLLNLQHLRRDQIWFCERRGLRSEVYALSEFSPRRDENLELGYLRGRYGAVPKVSVDPNWIKNISAVTGIIRGLRNEP